MAWSQFIRYTWYFGLALMLAALPLSRFFMSVSQFILAGAFILDGIDVRKIQAFYSENKRNSNLALLFPMVLAEGFRNLVRKFARFHKNKPAWIFSSILLIDLLGLIHSGDTANGIKVLRNNLPLFLLPLFLSSIDRIPRQTYQQMMLVFVAGVVAGTLNSTFLLINQEIVDTRQISAFIHHIRFSLMICMAVFILAFYFFKGYSFNRYIRWAFIPAIIWLIVSLVLLRSLSGILAFVVTLWVTMLFYAFRASNLPLRIILTAILIAFPLAIGFYVYDTVSRFMTVEPLVTENLETYTRQGGLYTHDPSLGIEEGKYIGLYICWDELQKEWNLRSDIPFDSLDLKGQEIKYTLIRYLNSKGLRKDSSGVAALTVDDIRYVEHGVANVSDLKKFSVRNRIHHLLLAWQDYRKAGFHPGSSAMERLEQGKVALNVFRENWLIGVGTGDVRTSFHQELKRMQSPLQSAQGGMFSSHNQFLSYLVAYGVIGGIWFLFAILYPALVKKAFRQYLFTVFITIVLISFLGDDTLNTQAGVSFFAFFYAWLVFTPIQDRDVQQRHDF